MEQQIKTKLIDIKISGTSWFNKCISACINDIKRNRSMNSCIWLAKVQECECGFREYYLKFQPASPKSDNWSHKDILDDAAQQNKEFSPAGETRETHEERAGRAGNEFDLTFYPHRRRGRSEDAQTRRGEDSWHLATGRPERPCPFQSVGRRFKLCYCTMIDGGSTRPPPGERDEMVVGGGWKKVSAH